MIGKQYIAGAALLGLVASHGWAYWRGGEAREARIEARHAEERERLQAELADVTAAALKAGEELIAAEERAEQLAEDLADAAREDPNADRRALGADSVRRIDRQ